MKAYYLFLKTNIAVVAFGWLLTFFSSFGQTFLISLYVPGIQESFHLTNSAFGVFYAICTILASAILLLIGHSIDHSPVRRIIYYTLFGLAASCLLLGVAKVPALLITGLIGLRLTGQGLMSHISLSVMSRYYHKGRGKALSLTSLGYPAGEAIFPVIVSYLILQQGWRFSMIASAVVLITLLFPILAKSDLERYDVPANTVIKTSQKLLWNDYLTIMKGKIFWRIAPSVFFLSFIITGIFFYQFIIAAKINWPASTYALFFTGYAIARFAFSLIGGIWIDRWGASKVFSFYLLPMCAGLGGIILIPGISGAAFFLILTGVSVGLSDPVKSAILAEVYGTKKIGTIRSLFTMIMVVSTALGPLLLGYLLDANFSINTIVILLVIFLFLSAFNSFWKR